MFSKSTSEAADGTPAFDALITSWRRSLLAEHKAAGTIASYLNELRLVRVFVARHAELPRDPRQFTRAHLETYLAEELTRRSPVTMRTAYVILTMFFKWLAQEGEIAASPVAHMKAPKAPPIVGAPVLSLAAIQQLLNACEGQTFADRRDLALMRVLLDTGLRRAEISALRLDDVSLDTQTIRVRHGKGDKARTVYVGVKAVKALDRYLRARGAHAFADLPQLWLSQRGAISGHFIREMLVKRAGRAGIDAHLHPHLFRHTWAHLWLDAGGSETDLCTMAGWSSVDMLRRYGASAKAARAQKAHARFSPADRF